MTGKTRVDGFKFGDKVMWKGQKAIVITDWAEHKEYSVAFLDEEAEDGWYWEWATPSELKKGWGGE